LITAAPCIASASLTPSNTTICHPKRRHESGRCRAAKEREEKLPKECPECHFMKPAGVYVCPKCGFKPLVGQDVETDGTRNIKK
jgi:predicted RNA-binding Zn-ribbon protein involved in translation (DUF1610 family)